MTQFTHKVKVPTHVVRKMPWTWLNENIGHRLAGWDLTWDNEPKAEGDESCILCFTNADDKARFILTWM
jgi:hypothetical protein